MREIKFRAWLKEEKIMIDVSEIDFRDEEVSGFDESDVFYEGYGYDYAELMQYTGLKDKNGGEIYEGDILEGYSVYPTKDTFQSKTLGDVYCSNRGTWDCYSFLLGDINEQMEVVGNIYDNPELMEVEECEI